MCTPEVLFATSIALSAAQTTAQYSGMQQQAKAQAAYQQRQMEAIRNAYRANLETLGLRQQQEHAAASSEAQRVQREALRARAKARTAAGEAGVLGPSIDALIRDLTAGELNYLSNTRVNLRNRLEQIQREKEGARAGAFSNLNLTAEPIEQPSLLAAGLRFGGDVLGAYHRYLYVPKRAKIEQPSR